MSDNVTFGTATYKKNAFIIVEDDQNSNEFYIIRQGKVLESRSVSIIEEDQTTQLGPGDFFGVISCMSKRARIENVTALEDTSVIIVKREQFGALIQKNAPVAMKILRYFGRQLRKYDSLLTKLRFQNSIEEDPNHLFKLGEYFLAKQKPIYAAYAFYKYMKTCPDGGYVPQAKSQIAKISPKNEDINPEKNNFLYIYKDGQIIFLEHEIGNELYIIQEGQVKITKLVNNNEVLLAVLKKGDIFGEMSLLDNKPRSASAIAFGPTKLMAVSRANFEPTVQAHPEIATRIIELLSERIWTIYKQLANILIKEPSHKLMDWLYTQLQKNRVEVKSRTPYTFDFGPDELSKFVGLNEKEAPLILKRFFEAYKFLSVVDNKITCKDIGEIDTQMKIIRRSIELEMKKKERAI